MIPNRRSIGALFALVALALGLAGPGAAQSEPVDLYAILSLTGPAAFLGAGEQASAQAFEKSVNAAGGINGHPVHLVIQDDQSNPAVCRQLADALLAKHVPAIVGPSLSAQALALQPVAEQGMVIYALTNAITPPSGSYLFAASVSTRESIIGLFRYLRGKGVRKLALLTSTDASGTIGEQQAVSVLGEPEFKTMQLVARERFGVTDLSVAAQIERIKAAGAEAIDAWTTGTPFGTVLRGAYDAG
jgi:branched-chain amino acid transport system substrate-binding protein